MPSLNSDNSVNILIGTEADDSGINKVSDSLGGMVDNFQSGMKKISVATAVVGAGLTAFAKSSTDYLTGLVKSSKSLATQTGLTIEQSSSLLAVFNRLGISADQTTTVFKTFSKQIADSRDNSASNALAQEQLRNKIDATNISIKQLTTQVAQHGDTSGALTNKIQGLNLQLEQYNQQLTSISNPLDRLNVATKNADGTSRGFNDILLDVADRFKSLPDGADKTALALQLFGKSGTQMIKVLDQGSDGIKNLEQQAQKLGLTLTAQNVGAINEYIKSQKDLTDSTNSIKIAVGSLTAPVLSKFNERLNSIIQSMVGINAPTRDLAAGILAFGGPVLGSTSAITGFIGSLDQSLPLLKSMGSFLVNPYFLIFAAAVALAAGSLYELQKQLGGWDKLLALVEKDLKEVGNVLESTLGPSIRALFNTIKDDLLPALDELFRRLSPVLIPVMKLWAELMGAEVVGAIWLVTNALNVAIQIVTLFANLFEALIVTVEVVVNFIRVKVEGMKNHFAEVVGAIIGFFATLPIMLPFYILDAMGRIIGYLASLNWGAIFGGILNAAENVAGGIWNAIYGVWSRLKSLDWGSLLGGVARDIGNTIINLLQGAINGALGHIPGHPSISLPHFEHGVENFSGGLAVVGDVAGRGGEIVALPAGSNVYSNKDSQRMMGGNGLTINQYINNQVDYSRGIAEIGFRLSNA